MDAFFLHYKQRIVIKNQRTNNYVTCLRDKIIATDVHPFL